MSKIFLIGDSHIGLGYPNKVDKWYEVHKQYFDNFLIPTLEKNVQKGDIIVHLGDLFDNRDIIPINLLNFAMDQVERISNVAPFHIIIGNHDCWSRSSDEINTVRPFKYMPNVHVYDKTTVLNYADNEILLMPYIQKKKEQVDLIQKYRHCDYLLCHSDLNGAKMHLTSVGHKNFNKIDVEDFKPFKHVYSGHIHLVQRNKNFTFVGSNFQMDRNDYTDQKGMFVFDVKTGEEEFIENNISPIFRKIKVIYEKDIEKLEKLKNTEDYIDLSISNNLLVTNRKLRRKLEVILESGNFASVEYIDDLNNSNDSDDKDDSELNESNEDIDMENIDISIQLDYEEYVKRYIDEQKYENEKFKEGVVSEYDNIIKIYKKNYKLNKNDND